MCAKKRTRRRRTPKGIFCLEGDWWNNLQKPSTVEPMLSLLGKWDPYFVPYVHKDIATRGEFEYYLHKWSQHGTVRFPILYLAFHGSPSEFFFGDQRHPENTVTLEELADLLEERCHKRIIYFGSCSTLRLHGNAIRGFLRRTGALAVCGYTKTVDWLDAASFELIVFSAMQRFAATVAGAEAMKRNIYRRAPFLARELSFRIVIAR